MSVVTMVTIELDCSGWEPGLTVIELWPMSAVDWIPPRVA